MRTRTSVTAAVFALIAATLAGCAAAPTGTVDSAVTADPSAPLTELTFLTDPHSYVGQSTAILSTDAIPTPDTAPEQSLPATVSSLDHAGDVPVTVTSAHTVNSESILALRPTLVITDGSIGPIDVVLQLREAGIPVVFVETTPSIDGVGELARQVSAALGAPAAGEVLAQSLVSGIEAKVSEIASVVPSGKPLRMMFLYLRGTSGIYYLFGKESGADVIISALGGVDVAAEIGLDGERPMTDEAVVAANPDLILVMTDGLASVDGVSGLLDSKPAIALTTAGQNRWFVDMADGEILSFGPRTADVLDALARAIYAPGS